MRLVPEWKLFLRHAWSIRISALAVFWSIVVALADAWPGLNGQLPISPVVFSAISGALGGGVILASCIYQENLHSGGKS